MTDKEKINAIRAEVQNYIDAAHKAHTNITEGNFAHLLSFIDSLQDEPIGEELEEASKEWLRPQLDKSYAAYGETKQMELTHFDGYAMLDAIEFGAKWGKNQAMAEIQAQSMALAHGCPEESESEDLEEAANNHAVERYKATRDMVLAEKCKWSFEAGAKWKEQQMMAKAVDVTVTGIREYKEENEVDFTLELEKGTIPYELEEDIKVILIKKN